MTAPLLEFRQVEKSFFGVPVLKKVSFSVPTGSMLGIVGENGAGKSTLMNILGGNLAPDQGEILISGNPLAQSNPREAERRGIAFIHQELNLFPNLTVAENLFLTRFPKTFGWINQSELNTRARTLLEKVGLTVSPQQKVETLSAGERQLLEIAKALSFEARLIIFDEPTTSLTAPEVEILFGLIAKLRAQGLTLIYISHTLADIFRLCDDILVLRDGERVAHGPTHTFNLEKLISLMVGRTLDQVFPVRKQTSSTETLLEVKNLCRDGILHNISFELHASEVLGISGLMGAGRSELARILFGLDLSTSGSITLDGADKAKVCGPRDRIRQGLAFLTENRRSEGLCMDGTISENFLLAALPNYTTGPLRWINAQKVGSESELVSSRVHLDQKAHSSQPVRTLSGGNQQKVVLGKWLLRHPRVLILDEPTRGIDVGAKAEIYRLINDLSAHGVGILLISSEIEELIGLSDRILVMRAGTFVDELGRSDFNRERILRAALGTEHRQQ